MLLNRTGGFPITSTAHAKGAIGRLDLNFALVLGARTEPECAARGLDGNRAGKPFRLREHRYQRQACLRRCLPLEVIQIGPSQFCSGRWRSLTSLQTAPPGA